VIDTPIVYYFVLIFVCFFAVLFRVLNLNGDQELTLAISAHW